MKLPKDTLLSERERRNEVHNETIIYIYAFTFSICQYMLGQLLPQTHLMWELPALGEIEMNMNITESIA
jgi:hypothetical protein